jgi:hypothetical protein
MATPAAQGFVPARPQDQGFVPARPEDQGFVPARPEDTAAPEHHWYDSAVSEMGDLTSGFKTALNQTGETAGKIVGATGIPQRINPQGWDQSMQQTHQIASAPMDTGGKMAGAAIENIIEYMAGDEALKGMTTAMKISHLASVERALQKSPVLTRMLGNAVRAQAVGTTQAATHGAGGTSAVLQGTAGAVTGGAVEGAAQGASKLYNLIRPGVTDILGEEAPMLASQKPGAAPMTESIARIQDEPEIAAQQQQAGQRGIVNRAQRTAASELHKLNSARAAQWVEGEGVMNLAPDAEATTVPTNRQLPSGQPQLPASTGAPGAPQLEGGAPQLEAGPQTGMARTDQVGAYEGEFPPTQEGSAAAPTASPATTEPTATPGPTGQKVKYVEEKPPNFAPIDVDSEIQGVRSFGDAADLIRKHAAPVFDRFDKATDGAYSRLRLERDAGYRAGDYSAVRTAEKGIDDLFDSTRGKIDRLDYKTAKTAWRSSRILDAVHDAVDKSFNIGDESLAQDAGTWRGINGGTLMRGVNRLTRDYGRTQLEDIIGKDGLTGLTKLSALTQSPQRAAMYGQKVGEVEHALMGGGRAGVIPSTIDWSRRALLHQLAINPRAGQAMNFAIQHNIPASTTAKILTSLLGNTITQQPTGAQ